MKTMAEPHGNGEVDAVLAELVNSEYAAILPEIREVVLANLCNGRFQRYQRVSTVPLPVYVQRIAETLKQDLALVKQLSARDDDAWHKQYDFLRIRAYYALMRKGIDHDHARERSHDLAQETCLALIRARFPGDVPYVAWVQRILRNRIELQLSRKPDLLDRWDVESLDGGLEDEDLAEEAIAVVGGFEEDVQARHDLETAIQRLPSPTQQTAVRMRLEGCEIREIAQAIGKSEQAVYNLLHRARQFFELDRRNGQSRAKAPHDGSHDLL